MLDEKPRVSLKGMSNPSPLIERELDDFRFIGQENLLFFIFFLRNLSLLFFFSVFQRSEACRAKWTISTAVSVRKIVL